MAYSYFGVSQTIHDSKVKKMREQIGNTRNHSKFAKKSEKKSNAKKDQ